MASGDPFKPSVKILLPGGYAVLYTFLCTIVHHALFSLNHSVWKQLNVWALRDSLNMATLAQIPDEGISFPTCAISRNSYKRMQVGLAELPK